MAERIAAGTGEETEYATVASKATVWGVIVTALTLVIVVLMVWKPTLWD